MKALRWLARNWQLKLVSVVLSVLLWSGLSGETTSEISLSVPLEFRGTPQQMVIMESSARAVTVQLRGRSRSIARASSGSVTSTIDLSGAAPGSTSLPVSAGNMVVPMGVEVLAIEPAEIKVVLDRLVARDLPVSPDIRNSLSSDFLVREVRTIPRTVEISGPESVVSLLESVSTRPIEIARPDEQSHVFAELDIRDPRIRVRGVSTVEVWIGLIRRPL